MFSRYDHRHHTSNRILFMPFHPLAHTYQWNSGNNYSHLMMTTLTKLFWIFILFLVFQTSWFGFFLSVAEGIVRKLAKCLYLHKRRHQIHCLTWAFFHISSQTVMFSHGNERRDSTKDSCQGHLSSLLLFTYKQERASLVAQKINRLPAMQRPRFDPWVGKILWKRKWQPTPVFLPGESHGQRSLAGYSS